MSAKPNRQESRVILRSPRLADRRAFLAAVRRSRAHHAGWVAPPKTPGEFADYVRRASTGTCCGFLVVQRDSAELVGVINLNNLIRGNFQNAFLGYYGFIPHARQGLMNEGMQMVVRHAFQALKLHRLEANIQPDNSASLALAKRNGFVLEGFSRRYLKVCGRWKDHQRWTLLAEDWKSRSTAAHPPRHPSIRSGNQLNAR